LNLIADLLKNYQIILASQSPRRINLLKSLGLKFAVRPANINEEIGGKLSPLNYCKKLSLLKTKSVTVADFNEMNSPKIVIAADTIVVLKNEIINKPKNEIDAFNILKKLSKNNHFVYTGVTVANSANGKTITKHSRTTVYFRELLDSEIYNYIKTGSPLDKAGAYGIQDDYGALFVKRIEGCYNNVIGLPLELLFRMLVEIKN
jgi:septum formation protein